MADQGCMLLFVNRMQALNGGSTTICIFSRSLRPTQIGHTSVDIRALNIRVITTGDAEETACGKSVHFENVCVCVSPTSFLRPLTKALVVD